MSPPPTSAGVGPGTPMEITEQGNNSRPIAAKVTSVFPSANDQTRTAIVEAIIPNPGNRLLPGAFVTVHLAKPSTVAGTQVPAAAIVTEGGGAFVWLAQGGAAAPLTYQCEKCHMVYSAQDAQKRHYIDPMDGGRLLPVSAPARASAGLTAHRVAVQTGASDGAWTQISGADIPLGSRVVTRGQAGLIDGGTLVATAWGEDGPRSLPTAAAAAQGKAVYRCEKCGMTYSAADAERNHFVDPMDGGRLVRVKAQ